MILNNDVLKILCNIAEKASLLAGKIIIEKSSNFKQLKNKENGTTEASSVLTEVDVLSQKIILETLKDTFNKYDLGLLTEESIDNHSRLTKDYFWSIDPMDGTLAFIKGKPGFSVSIALINKKGIPYIGVVYNPVTKDLYSAIKGRGLYKNREQYIPKRNKKENLTFIHDGSFKKSNWYNKSIEELKKIARSLDYSNLNIIDYGGAVLNAIWVIENSPGVYFKFPKNNKGGGAIWDFASTNLFFNELNNYDYKCSDIKGDSVNFNSPETLYFNKTGIIYASDSKLQESIINLSYKIKK